MIHIEKRLLRAALGVVLIALAALAPVLPARAQTPKTVIVATIDGPVMQPAADYLERCLRRAEQEGATCLLVELNTPGGDLYSTRQIAQRFLAAKVPVVVYVAPAGSRAGSAGAVISLAADVLAMAPGTNIGAAHPVSGTGENIESDMRDKVVNDTAALARSLAERHGKDTKWAEDVVRHSLSTSENETLKRKVADLIAANRAELLEKLNGRKVLTSAGVKTLETHNAKVEEQSSTFSERMLQFLYDPNIALILFVLAIIGLAVEFSHPGASLPGVAGAICLILALFAASALSVNATGVILLLGAITLFVTELYAPTHGVLTVGGMIAFVTGALFLFNPGVTGVSVSLPLVMAMAAVMGLFFIVVVGAAIKAQDLPPGTGPETMIGMLGVARTPVNPEGTVFADGAIWNAVNAGVEPIAEGDSVRIEGRDGLTLRVRRAEPASAEPIWSRESPSHPEESPQDPPPPPD